MSELDLKIAAALESLGSAVQKQTFDYAAYAAAFRQSAQAKAHETLVAITETANPFPQLRPVFLSIGGADGEELACLLQQSKGEHGILIERNRDLAQIARDRTSSLGPKNLQVLEGDAQDRIAEAVELASSLVEGGEGDFIVVTCHAVIHELFDRGKQEFDPLAFFATIFGSDKSIWFTYREPGAPEKWPPKVLLKAICSPKSLLHLAEAIISRHPSFRTLKPKPTVVGDHLMLHKTLALEVLAKLFYLDDLAYEIEERSTAVEHPMMVNSLWLAIGTSAREEKRAHIETLSKPTGSFDKFWLQYGVEVLGLDDANNTQQVAAAESQTRVIAWRISAEQSPSQFANLTTAELQLAEQALTSGDELLVTALIESKARAWIETSSAPAAIRLLELTEEHFPPSEPAHLWSHYNLCLAKLFSGREINPGWFLGDLLLHADRAGIGMLFRAECMEFHRKAGNSDAALEIANQLRCELEKAPFNASPTISYVAGTANFLMGNLLRHGGAYQLASEYVAKAKNLYRPKLDSHDTELAHCYYSRQVCIAMTGMSAFDAPFDDASESIRRFAHALINLSYAHAAWFVGDIARAQQWACDAARRFEGIGYTQYSRRAENLAGLLGIWQTRRNHAKKDYSKLDPTLKKVVLILVGEDNDYEWFASNFARLRPSTAVGVLQFAMDSETKLPMQYQFQLPRTLSRESNGQLTWRGIQFVGSLEDANTTMRANLSIPTKLRVPVLAD